MTCCQYTSFGLENCNSVCECKGVSIPSKISIAKAPWKEIWSCWLANIVYYNSMAILSKHHLYWCWRNLQRVFFGHIGLKKHLLSPARINWQPSIVTWRDWFHFNYIFHQKSKLCLIKHHGPKLIGSSLAPIWKMAMVSWNLSTIEKWKYWI